MPINSGCPVVWTVRDENEGLFFRLSFFHPAVVVRFARSAVCARALLGVTDKTVKSRRCSLFVCWRRCSCLFEILITEAAKHRSTRTARKRKRHRIKECLKIYKRKFWKRDGMKNERFWWKSVRNIQEVLNDNVWNKHTVVWNKYWLKQNMFETKSNWTKECLKQGVFETNPNWVSNKRIVSIYWSKHAVAVQI